MTVTTSETTGGPNGMWRSSLMSTCSVVVPGTRWIASQVGLAIAGSSVLGVIGESVDDAVCWATLQRPPNVTPETSTTLA